MQVIQSSRDASDKMENELAASFATMKQKIDEFTASRGNSDTGLPFSTATGIGGSRGSGYNAEEVINRSMTNNIKVQKMTDNRLQLPEKSDNNLNINNPSYVNSWDMQNDLINPANIEVEDMTSAFTKSLKQGTANVGVLEMNEGYQGSGNEGNVAMATAATVGLSVGMSTQMNQIMDDTANAESSDAIYIVSSGGMGSITGASTTVTEYTASDMLNPLSETIVQNTLSSSTVGMSKFQLQMSGQWNQQVGR